MFPFCKDRSYAQLSVAIIITGKRNEEGTETQRRSQETSLRVLLLSRHLVEGGGGDDGEDALHDVVGSELEDEGESLVQYLLRVIIR